MHDLHFIKSTVANNPLPFLQTLYGESVRRTGNSWRVGSKGGRCFDTAKGELLCATFNGDAGQATVLPSGRPTTTAIFGTPWNKSPPVTACARAEHLQHHWNASSVHRYQSSIQKPVSPSAPILGRNLMAKAASLFEAACHRVRSEPDHLRTIADWRGWPEESARRFAAGMHIGFAEFPIWPSIIEPQPAAFFRVLHPCEVIDKEQGLARTSLTRDVFSGHIQSAMLDKALTELEQAGLAHRTSEETSGAPREVWRAN